MLSSSTTEQRNTMSDSDRLTNSLLRASNQEEVIAVIKELTPLFSGYAVTSVTFNGSLMVIDSVKSFDNAWGRGEIPTCLLSTDLATGKDAVGRKEFLGLSLIDLTVILNVVNARR